jgi:hypothetical protein
MTGGLGMATRNYRQAKRNREETKKKKQQEKLQRKQNRGTTPEGTEEPTVDETSTEPKAST